MNGLSSFSPGLASGITTPASVSSQPRATRFGAGSTQQLTGSTGKGTVEQGRNWLGNWVKVLAMGLVVKCLLNPLQSKLIQHRQKLVGHLDHHLGWNVQTNDAKGKAMPPPKWEQAGKALSFWFGTGSTDQLIPEPSINKIGQNG